MCGEAHLSFYRQRVHASATTAIYLLHERSSFALRDAANSVRGIDRMSSRSLAAPPYYFPGGLTAVVNDSKTAHLASAFFCPNVHTLSFCSAPPRGRGALAHAPPYITKAYKYIYLSNTRGRVQSIQNFAATCRRHSSGEHIFLMEISVGLHVYFPMWRGCVDAERHVRRSSRRCLRRLSLCREERRLCAVSVQRANGSGSSEEFAVFFFADGSLADVAHASGGGKVRSNTNNLDLYNKNTYTHTHTSSTVFTL